MFEMGRGNLRSSISLNGLANSPYGGGNIDIQTRQDAGGIRFIVPDMIVAVAQEGTTNVKVFSVIGRENTDKIYFNIRAENQNGIYARFA